jgi:AcrR family transcriptional regulator
MFAWLHSRERCSQLFKALLDAIVKATQGGIAANVIAKPSVERRAASGLGELRSRGTPTMPAVSKKETLAAASTKSPVQWEERSTQRVLQARREQLLERSRSLVEAASDLLQQDGLEGLTIRSVLKRTGLSRRAFYERFADKDELVLAVFEYTIRLITRRCEAQDRTLSNPLERLKFIVTYLVLGESSSKNKQTGQRAAAISQEHLRLAQCRPDDLQAALSPLLALIARHLSDGMDAGLIRRTNPQRQAALIYNLISTTVHTALLTKQSAHASRAHRSELARDIWAFCYHGIAD